MVNIHLWGRSAAELAPVIENQHQTVFTEHNKFYLHYPVLQRWKLKTKEQHLKSVRFQKGKNYVCKWCTLRSCTFKINSMQDFFDHITQVSKNKCTYSMLTEDEYRERRGWQPVDNNQTNQASSLPKSKKSAQKSTKSTDSAKATKKSTSRTTSKPSSTVVCMTNLSPAVEQSTFAIKRQFRESSTDPTEQQPEQSKKIKVTDTNDLIEEHAKEYIAHMSNLENRHLALNRRTDNDRLTLSYETNLENETNKKQKLNELLTRFAASIPDDFNFTNLSVSVN